MLGYCTTLIALIAGCSSDTTIGTMGTNRVGTVILTAPMGQLEPDGDMKLFLAVSAVLAWAFGVMMLLAPAQFYSAFVIQMVLGVGFAELLVRVRRMHLAHA
jgi:hypothetical protein